MRALPRPGGFAIAIFLVLAPVAIAGGALALPVLLCLAGAIAIRPDSFRQVIENKPLALALLLALTGWAMLSTAWSPLPLDDQVWKLAALVPLGSVFVASATADAQMRRLMLAGAIAVCASSLVLLAGEAWLDFPLNREAQPNEPHGELLRIGGHAVTVLIGLTWAAAGGLIALGGGWRRIGAAVLLLGAGALSLQFDQLGNAVAFAAGLAAFALGFAAPRLGLLLISGGLAAWQVLAPFVAPLLSDPRLVDNVPRSWAARTAIWDYASARVMEQPIIGHGLEASRAVTEKVYVRGMELTAIPVHPHSASLQIWYETGAIGALLAAAVLITGGLWLARAFDGNRAGAAAACATLASLGLIANFSYGIWAEWWMATLFIAAAAVGSLRGVTRL